jgi:hypothetical protein
MWQGEARQSYNNLARNIESAVRALPNWAGSTVTLTAFPDRDGPINWFGSDEPKLRVQGSVYVHGGSAWKNQPSFTLFSSEAGEVQGVDDVLDAGDGDFFRDPAVEADYFGLTEELRTPGKARRLGNKVIALYTARPKKDRHAYEHAKHIPNNVFLTTDPDEAWGYSRDLGGDRDIYKIRIKHMYLVETLDVGYVKNYQSFSGQGNTAPVESIELIHEGERTATARVLARWIRAQVRGKSEYSNRTTGH